MLTASVSQTALFLCTFGLSAASLAQNVTLGAVTATPIQLATSAGSSTATGQVPQGTVATAAVSDLRAILLGVHSFAAVGWRGPTQLQNGEIEYRYQLRTEALGLSAGVNSSSVSTHQVLLTLQPQAPRPYRIVAEITADASPGQTAPRLDVDLFDDSVVDGDPVTGTASTGVLTTGSAVLVRLTAACSASATLGQLSKVVAEVRLRVQPLNDVTIVQTGVGCPLPLEFRVNEAFDHRGVRLGLPNSQELHVVVLGLAAQPMWLPVGGSWPCLLMPSPDVLVLGQPGGVDLPIPASVRPFSFHTQAVALLGFTGQMVLTESYAVVAN